MICAGKGRRRCWQQDSGSGTVLGDGGSGTVLAVGLVFVVLVLLSALLIVVQAVVAAQRASNGADLAALAAADAARGLAEGEPCSVARALADRNQVKLLGCKVTGPDRDVVEVMTGVDLPNGWGTATGRARAGPPP